MSLESDRMSNEDRCYPEFLRQEIRQTQSPKNRS